VSSACSRVWCRHDSGAMAPLSLSRSLARQPDGRREVGGEMDEERRWVGAEAESVFVGIFGRWN
jgi:hypothetical protein